MRNFAAVQVVMGRSQERAGDLRGAEAAYQAALRNDATSAEAMHRLALVKEKLGAGEEAELQLLRAAKQAPRNAEIRCDLGYYYALREQWPEAQRFYEQAIELKPNFPRAHNNLGMLLARCGDARGAMRHFSAAGLTPAEANSNLGFAYMSQQQWGSARDELQRALQRNPSLKQANVLAAALDNLEGAESPSIASGQRTRAALAIRPRPDAVSTPTPRAHEDQQVLVAAATDAPLSQPALAIPSDERDSSPPAIVDYRLGSPSSRQAIAADAAPARRAVEPGGTPLGADEEPVRPRSFLFVP